jgi:hypothetical protein
MQRGSFYMRSMEMLYALQAVVKSSDFTVILGWDGYIELRKYIDIARDPEGDQL